MRRQFGDSQCDEWATEALPKPGAVALARSGLRVGSADFVQDPHGAHHVGAVEHDVHERAPAAG